MNVAFLALTFLLFTGLCVLGSAVHWVACRLSRIPVHTITVFNGRPIATMSLGPTTIAFGYIPIGTSVTFDVPQFRSRPLAVRLAVLVSGPVALVLLAFVLLGWSNAMHHFLGGFTELYLGALRPRTTALDLIGRLHAIFSSSTLAVFGVLAAKLAACSFLPIGSVTAAQLLQEVFRSYEQGSWGARFAMVSALGTILLNILWVLAGVLYALR